MSKKEKTKKQPKEKKVPVLKIGTHKKTVIALWLVLIGSVSFGVYKNFTAIDMHTVHEKEIIQQELVDTNGIENFVKDFAKSYYSWSTSKEAIEQRTSTINQYMTKELQDLNVDTVRIDIPTSSTVKDVQVWGVKQTENNEFDVVYKVTQAINEGEQTTDNTAIYMVKVHTDSDGYIITQNPTLTSTMKTSSYEPKAKEADASIDAVITQDATAFLETFFKLYPNATEKELAYYVKGNVLPQISGEYLYSELINPIFMKDGDNLKVSLSVKYLDQQTKATQISQYDLTLQKGDNWTIIK